MKGLHLLKLKYFPYSGLPGFPTQILFPVCEMSVLELIVRAAVRDTLTDLDFSVLGYPHYLPLEPFRITRVTYPQRCAGKALITSSQGQGNPDLLISMI